jgi:VanZ family protein
MIKKNFFSILMVLIIMYLSLTNGEKFEKFSLLHITFMDKIVHFVMYFVMMSVIIFEHRKTIRNARHLFLIALIPFSYGVLMEILQSILTVSRTGSFIDVIFNTAGISVSVLLSLLINPLSKETII